MFEREVMRHVLLVCLAVALVGGCKKKKAEEAPAPGPAVAMGTAAGTAAPTPGSAAEPAGSGAAAPTAGSSAAPAAAAYCGATPCPCKAGSEQKDGDKLKMCELEKAASVGGVECGAGRVLFHDDGSLAECLPTADAKVGDYACKKAPLTVAWHKGGKLRACTLAADATI